VPWYASNTSRGLRWAMATPNAARNSLNRWQWR
jgi:hypothetical protein